MKALTKATLIVALVGAMALPTTLVGKSVKAASNKITTTATGYTKASDVNYITKSGTVVNWGARNEDCSFLSKYAESFYTGSYEYEILSTKSGGTGQGNAASSNLYKALQTMMRNEHTHQTSYAETKDLYCYTDCVSNQYSNISSFYSGKELTGKWDSAATWNREHTWPDSKGLGGNDENDIMMLRPTWVQENSSRGNTAYGESDSYYDPGRSTRGDCARIVLYVYVRWGNISKMWGSSGVMESLNVLLRWMEEDPVDTWEMGRNDAVQSITGTRNVFVDYPEYAWLLFGRQIPQVVTPSGAQSGEMPDTSLEDSSTGISGSASDMPDSSVADSTTDIPDSSDEDIWQEPDSSELLCQHEFGVWHVTKKPTETEGGEQERFCKLCGYSDKQTIPMLSESGTATESGEEGESSDGQSNENGGGMAGCQNSVYSVAPILLLGAFSVFVLKKRKNSK